MLEGALTAGGQREGTHKILVLAQRPLRPLDVLQRLRQDALFERGKLPLDLGIELVVQHLKRARDPFIRYSDHRRVTSPYSLAFSQRPLPGGTGPALDSLTSANACRN